MAQLHRRKNSPNGNEQNIKDPVKISKKKKKRFFSKLRISKLTVQASRVLMVAMIGALIWNQFDSVNPLIRKYLEEFCMEHYCHGALVPTQRTQKASRNIDRGQRLVEIPRSLQIWDLDALRDEFIRIELFSARINDKPLESAAFLAAYIAKLRLDRSASVQLDRLLSSYLQLLPSYEDYASFHPMLWSDSDQKNLLGEYTLAYATVKSFQMTVRKEYDSFCQESTRFANIVSREDYETARLAVMTRSFGTGPIPMSETKEVALSDELEKYRRDVGVDLTLGSHAMVPVLDFYNHHANPNVGFSYDFSIQAFVVSSLTTIAAGAEIFDSYGKHTQDHLFAKYGFINDDGSEYTKASLALWHNPNDLNNHRQSLQILRYLQYDDGYESCVREVDGEAWKLKRLKYQHLMAIANESSRWTVTLPPRNPKAKPPVNSNTPTRNAPHTDLSKLQFDAKKLFSTCQLISLTHFDYNGTALQYLERGESLPSTSNDGLEFRTLMCIARMSSTAIARFPSDVESVASREVIFSREWTAKQVIKGEWQSLQALKRIALSSLQRYRDLVDSEPAFTMRNHPCSRESLEPLLKDWS